MNEEGLLRPARSPQDGGIYLGGNAPLVEEFLGLSGDEILYVGDHLYSDVHVTKSILRWRTALILIELESEIRAIEGFGARQEILSELMGRKVALEAAYCRMRLDVQRKKGAYGPTSSEPLERVQKAMEELRGELYALDKQIAPVARSAGEMSNARWGLTMRTGNDKSYLARQVERYADIYLSRVSNLLYQTPFVYLRSHRGSLPHDPPDAVPLPKPDALAAEESSVYDAP